MDLIGIPSERLERKLNRDDDSEFCLRIIKFLDHPDIDEFCMVDAYYYDFSEIPNEIIDKYRFFRDMYLVYGITNKGEIISKWVERYDLDSNKEITEGSVINK